MSTDIQPTPRDLDIFADLDTHRKLNTTQLASIHCHSKEHMQRLRRRLQKLRGRNYVLPQDVYDVAYDVLNHRLVLSYEALAEGVTVDDVLVELLSTMPAPRITIRGEDLVAS